MGRRNSKARVATGGGEYDGVVDGW